MSQIAKNFVKYVNSKFVQRNKKVFLHAGSVIKGRNFCRTPFRGWKVLKLQILQNLHHD